MQGLPTVVIRNGILNGIVELEPLSCSCRASQDWSLRWLGLLNPFCLMTVSRTRLRRFFRKDPQAVPTGQDFIKDPFSGLAQGLNFEVLGDFYRHIRISFELGVYGWIWYFEIECFAW